MIYIKTEAGRSEVARRTLPLSPAQRQVLILCDGERHVEDLGEMMPASAVQPALEPLLAGGLLALKDAAVKEKPALQPLTESERYRAIVEMATDMAVDLGFTARIKAQLRIERAQSIDDLTDVVRLLCKHLDKSPLMALRLNKLRQLAHA